jgi:DNA-binding MarR family transcriptional regulator/GNAT superfamily N-acetyltransferase
MLLFMAAGSSLARSTASFRSFNRAYTRFLGTLNDHYLGTDYSLAEGRVLYGLATQPKLQAKKIAEELGLDAGYLSRILRKFERGGLVVRATAKDDRRAADLRLTSAGRAVVRMLNARANTQAEAVLGKLSTRERMELAKAFSTIEEMVLDRRSEPDSIELRKHQPGDMGAVVQMEGAGYVEQLGWDETFEALVARIVADFIKNFDAKRERCWIAEINGVHVGHIFLVRDPGQPDTAKLRLLYVDPSARGLGLGGRLVDECVRFARSAGYEKVTLWTQSILTSAHRLYQAAGFRLVREESHQSFGKVLIGQTWEMDLH